MRWIKCSERLPEMNYQVLGFSDKYVWLIHREQVEGYPDGWRWRTDGASTLHPDTIKYWQPLPEPPKDGE